MLKFKHQLPQFEERPQQFIFLAFSHCFSYTHIYTSRCTVYLSPKNNGKTLISCCNTQKRMCLDSHVYYSKAQETMHRIWWPLKPMIKIESKFCLQNFNNIVSQKFSNAKHKTPNLKSMFWNFCLIFHRMFFLFIILKTRMKCNQ